MKIWNTDDADNADLHGVKTHGRASLKIKINKYKEK
jgi:hypothetical protein